jgi:hypothetical protein
LHCIRSSYIRDRNFGEDSLVLFQLTKTSSGEEKSPAAATAGPRDKDFTGCALRRSVSHGETTRRAAGLSTFHSPQTVVASHIPISMRGQSCAKKWLEIARMFHTGIICYLSAKHF